MTREADELRELIREAHGAAKDLRAAKRDIDEALARLPQIIDAHIGTMAKEVFQETSKRVETRAHQEVVDAVERLVRSADRALDQHLRRRIRDPRLQAVTIGVAKKTGEVLAERRLT